jgi:hypothetical protein
MNELLARWKTESPKFFEAVMRFGLWVAAAGLSVLASTEIAPAGFNPTLLHLMKEVGEHMVWGGGLIAAVSKLTVKDYSEMEKKMKK